MQAQYHPYLNLQTNYITTDAHHIKGWLESVVSAFKQTANLEDWLLVGRAVSVIGDDGEQATYIIHTLANEVQIKIKTLSATAINEQIDALAKETIVTPTLVILEYGAWCHEQQAQDTNQEQQPMHAQHLLIQEMNRSAAKRPIVFVMPMNVNQFNTFSKALKQAGLFDQRFTLRKPSLEEIGEQFIQAIGTQSCDKEILQNLEKVGAIVIGHVETARHRGIYAINLLRRAKKQNRLIGFTDLIELIHNGIGHVQHEPMGEEALHYIATHEAGHALMAIIDSSGENIPEYVSIMKSENYGGIVVESYDYNIKMGGISTYKKIRHTIRVALAGRVAEEIMFGVENTHYEGSESDMQNASQLCYHMFKCCGVSPNIEQEISAEKFLPNPNLRAFIDGEDTEMDKHKINLMVANYLEAQYEWVRHTLKNNQNYLIQVRNQLVQNKVVLSYDFKSLLLTAY